MGEVSYAPLIKDMTWSYSRAKAFDDCPYRWFLRYIRKIHGEEMFFSSYGTFMHELIDLHYKEGLTAKQMQEKYLKEFRSKVVGEAPNEKVFVNYFTGGLQYLKNFTPLPYNVVETEKEVHFDIYGIPLVGHIDYLGEENGDLHIIDNKSKKLRPRSGRRFPTKTDEELDSYLRQLYLYAAAVEQEYGKLPKTLSFNCFRTQTFINEPFDHGAYEEAKQWFVDKVNKITEETDFPPIVEDFKCEHICECRDICEYYKLSKG